MSTNLKRVGSLSQSLIDLSQSKLLPAEVFMSDGLVKHLIAHNHKDCIPYANRVADILAAPDYIGKSPKQSAQSIELVKTFDHPDDTNVCVGIKLDTKNGCLYVATIDSIQIGKLERRINSGRIKKVLDN